MARLFLKQLRNLETKNAPKRWLYVPYDQLSDRIGPLASSPLGSVGIVMVESSDKAARRPYHKQKLALVLSNQRQFALEQAGRGVPVDYRFSSHSIASVLQTASECHGPLTMMEGAERELRQEVQPLVEAGCMTVVPHEGWLTEAADFEALGAPPWRMDAFYRQVRRRTGWLMKGGKPAGGRFSFDGENRQPWRGDPPLPEPPRFEPDAVTLEVCQMIEERFAGHPGRLDPYTLPSTQRDADRLWRWARDECMTHFGTYEDAMTRQSRGLFHTRVASLMNLHRLLPAAVVSDVAESDAPLNAREGFVRQVLGWREFVRHVHRRTDGMRQVGERTLVDPLGRDRALPPAFWQKGRTNLLCLDDAVDAVWDEGWTHHIVRLMVLANLATLLDVRPWELSDWFWVGFIDAFDWVVEPNVVGMGTFGVGPLMTTKPYISGSNYLNKMGDACKSCAFHPKKTCPITPLYWAFLARHEEVLSGVDRLRMPLRSLQKRAPERRARDAAIFDWVIRTLQEGQLLSPDAVPEGGS